MYVACHQKELGPVVNIALTRYVVKQCPRVEVKRTLIGTDISNLICFYCAVKNIFLIVNIVDL